MEMSQSQSRVFEPNKSLCIMASQAPVEQGRYKDHS